MKLKIVIWIVSCLAVLFATAILLFSRPEKNVEVPEDFRLRLTSEGTMQIDRENKHVTIDGEEKQALVSLLNSLTIEPKLGGPEPTLAPGYLFSIESKSEDGSKEASISIKGMQWIREYRGDRLIDYELSKQDYQTLCNALYELF